MYLGRPWLGDTRDTDTGDYGPEKGAPGGTAAREAGGVATREPLNHTTPFLHRPILHARAPRTADKASPQQGLVPTRLSRNAEQRRTSDNRLQGTGAIAQRSDEAARSATPEHPLGAYVVRTDQVDSTVYLF